MKGKNLTRMFTGQSVSKIEHPPKFNFFLKIGEGNKKGNQLYVPDALGNMWRPRRDLNPCRRRERPILKVRYLILRPSMSVEVR